MHRPESGEAGPGLLSSVRETAVGVPYLRCCLKLLLVEAF
jgi:hypothetical protein